MMIKNNYLLFFSFCLLIQTGCTHTPNTPESKSISSLLTIAERLRLQGNEKTSQGFYQQVLEKDPTNSQAHLGLGKMFRHHKDYKSALKHFQTAALGDPHNNEIQTELIKIYIETQQGHTAALNARRLLQKDPKNPITHMLYGVALDLKTHHKEAQKAYRAALALKPDYPPIRSNLGLSLVFSQSYSEAIALLEPLTQTAIATPKDRHNLAIAYALSGQLAKAEPLFRMDLDPIKAQENMRYLAKITLKAPSLLTPHLAALPSNAKPLQK